MFGPLDSSRLLHMTSIASNPTILSWNGPVLYSPTSTVPNEPGRYLIVNQTHIRSHPAICTELPTFQLVVQVMGLKSSRTSLVKRRPPLHSDDCLLCGISSLSCESNHDVEHGLEALLAHLGVLAKPLKDGRNNLYSRLTFVLVLRNMNRSLSMNTLAISE